MSGSQKNSPYGDVRAFYARRLHEQGKTAAQIRAALRKFDKGKPAQGTTFDGARPRPN